MVDPEPVKLLTYIYPGLDCGSRSDADDHGAASAKLPLVSPPTSMLCQGGSDPKRGKRRRNLGCGQTLPQHPLEPTTDLYRKWLVWSCGTQAHTCSIWLHVFAMKPTWGFLNTGIPETVGLLLSRFSSRGARIWVPFFL